MNKNIPRHGRDVGQIRRLIHEAMEIWQHNSNLKLRESGEDTADILIDFAKGNHGDNFDFNGMGGSLGEFSAATFSSDWHSSINSSSTSQLTRSILARESGAMYTWMTMKSGTLRRARRRSTTLWASSTLCSTSLAIRLVSGTHPLSTRSCIPTTRHRELSTELTSSFTRMTSTQLSSCMDLKTEKDVTVQSDTRQHDTLRRRQQSHHGIANVSENGRPLHLHRQRPMHRCLTSVKQVTTQLAWFGVSWWYSRILGCGAYVTESWCNQTLLSSSECGRNLKSSITLTRFSREPTANLCSSAVRKWWSSIPVNTLLHSTSTFSALEGA